MLPTLRENAIYGIKKIDVNAIEVGDIIAFYIHEKVICHRVIKKIISSNGTVFFETKGDNCKQKDGFVVRGYMVIGKIIVN